MGHYTDISNSQYSAQGTAHLNEMNGVRFDNPWVMAGMSAAMQLTNFFTNSSANGNANVKEENADDNYANNILSSIKEYNKLVANFKKDKTPDNWNKLEKYYNEHKDENPMIKLPDKPETIKS